MVTTRLGPSDNVVSVGRITPHNTDVLSGVYSNNFAGSVALAEVCALLSAVLVKTVISRNRNIISHTENVLGRPVLYKDLAIHYFLVHHASKTHWATRFLQLLLSSAASSNSSQLMPIFLGYFLTTSFQFCRGRPGLILKPSGSHVRACRGSLW